MVVDDYDYVNNARCGASTTTCGSEIKTLNLIVVTRADY